MEITPDKIRMLEDFVAHYNVIKSELGVVNNALGEAIQQRDSVYEQIIDSTAALSHLKNEIQKQIEELQYQTKLTEDRKKELRDSEALAEVIAKENRENSERDVERLRKERVGVANEIAMYKDRISVLQIEETLIGNAVRVLKETYENVESTIKEKREELKSIETEIHGLRRERSVSEVRRAEVRSELDKIENETKARRSGMKMASDALLEREKDLVQREEQLLIRENRYKAAMQKYFPNVAV